MGFLLSHVMNVDVKGQMVETIYISLNSIKWIDSLLSLYILPQYFSQYAFKVCFGLEIRFDEIFCLNFDDPLNSSPSAGGNGTLLSDLQVFLLY